MLDSTYQVHSDTLVVGSRIESNSFVNKRLALIDLVEFSCFCVYPHGVAIDSVKFQSFSMVARDLEAMHVDRLTAEGVHLTVALLAMRISFFWVLAIFLRPGSSNLVCEEVHCHTHG